jgi:4-hydroxybenzoate polyprenyltransferase
MRRHLDRAGFWLRTSRPGLWFSTVWLYLLPLGGMSVADSWRFWLGLALVTFPLNFLFYGLNDLVDRETDRANPRKGGGLWGARGSEEQLRSLPPALCVVAAGFALAILSATGPALGWALGGLALVLLAYDHPTRGLRGRPPWELVGPAGYLLVVPISTGLVGAPALPWPTWIYLALFGVQSQLVGELFDIEPDRRARRRTTATVLGVAATKRLLVAVVALEAGLLLGPFREPWLGALFAGALAWLVFDLRRPGSDRPWSPAAMRGFGLVVNVVALVTMVYVWRSRCLLEPGG